MDQVKNDLAEHGRGEEPVETCDCRRCALAFRDVYKQELASISEEIGLPPTIGPAPGALKAAMDAGKSALDRIRDAPKAVSKYADFERMTWTLGIIEGGRGGAGVYAMVWLGDHPGENGESN